jgi:DNA-directed RNA polymerase specialized sigma24 family protein
VADIADNDWLAQRFEDQRDRLRGVADRMLGSLVEADDTVQDAWLRASPRVFLNMLRARFEPPFEEIAPMIERTPGAARQLASRARRRVRGAEPANG